MAAKGAAAKKNLPGEIPRSTNVATALPRSPDQREHSLEAEAYAHCTPRFEEKSGRDAVEAG